MFEVQQGKFASLGLESHASHENVFCLLTVPVRFAGSFVAVSGVVITVVIYLRRICIFETPTSRQNLDNNSVKHILFLEILLWHRAVLPIPDSSLQTF